MNARARFDATALLRASAARALGPEAAAGRGLRDRLDNFTNTRQRRDNDSGDKIAPRPEAEISPTPECFALLKASTSLPRVRRSPADVRASLTRTFLGSA